VLENPYASVQVRDIPDEPPVAERSPAGNPAPAPPALVSAPVSPLADTRHGNPYASLAGVDVEESYAEPARKAGSAKGELSKAAFVAGCRRIFAQYIPHLERGRLRPEHRDFITRNSSHSPKVRSRLLQELSRYDLSDLPGMQPQFNREDDRLTVRKLIEIEQAVDKDE
jgi:hypothetical protein